jgi:hypothetical protein
VCIYHLITCIMRLSDNSTLWHKLRQSRVFPVCLNTEYQLIFANMNESTKYKYYFIKNQLFKSKSKQVVCTILLDICVHTWRWLLFASTFRLFGEQNLIGKESTRPYTNSAQVNSAHFIKKHIECITLFWLCYHGKLF